jgi:ubiquinol-cytochrome c reductase iron-sulfur subunit
VTEQHETRTAVTLTPATWNDDHLQPASRHPEHVERVIALLFFFGLVAFALFGAAYWQNWKAWTMGATLGAGMVLVGAGLTAWGKYLMPKGPFVEDRHPLKSPPDELAAFENAVMERGVTPVRRRPVLGGLLGAGLGVFGIVALFPLVRSMGPLPGKTLDQTNWKKGSYLVDSAGRRVHAGDLGLGSIMTVFPEGYEADEQSAAQDQTLLIRADTSPIQLPDNTYMPGTPLGYVAYSKLCTHLGCPVGLYERALNYLVCPCHQSMFNVVDNGLPLFGPAPRPLPQLQLAIDRAGFLVAAAPYDQPVGPGFWERS